MKPMLDRKRDLKGATPENLARALLKPIKRSSRAHLSVERVVSNKVSVKVKKVSTNHPSDHASHLSKSS